jgi:DNA-binding transcriptional LysR family regulator
VSNLRYMRTFIAVAKTGSFSAAAEKMALTQAGISTQMRALEEDLKHELFDRSGRTVCLNDYGKSILPEFERIVAIYSKVRATAGGEDSVAGTVEIGAVVSAMAMLAKSIIRLKRNHDGLDIRLFTGKSVELVERVEAGDLEAALTIDSPVRLPTSVEWRKLYSEPLVVVAPASASAEDPIELIRSMPFLRFDRTQHTGLLIDRTLRKLRVHVDDFLELNSIETIVELVRQEVGVALIPKLRFSTWETESKLRIVNLYDNLPPRAVGLIERKGHSRGRVIEQVYADLTSY